MAEPKPVPFDAAQWHEWEYERPQGDLCIYAPTKEHAIAELQAHGITNINPAKLKLRDRMLTDVLHKEGIR
jgi:hypothetical protein